MSRENFRGSGVSQTDNATIQAGELSTDANFVVGSIDLVDGKKVLRSVMSIPLPNKHVSVAAATKLDFARKSAQTT